MIAIYTPRRHGAYEAESRKEDRRKRASWAVFVLILITCGVLAVKLTAARHQIIAMKLARG